MSSSIQKPCKCGATALIEVGPYNANRPTINGSITYCAVCGRKRARFVSNKGNNKVETKYAPRQGFGPQPTADAT